MNKDFHCTINPSKRPNTLTARNVRLSKILTSSCNVAYSIWAYAWPRTLRTAPQRCQYCCYIGTLCVSPSRDHQWWPVGSSSRCDVDKLTSDRCGLRAMRSAKRDTIWCDIIPHHRRSKVAGWPVDQVWIMISITVNRRRLAATFASASGQ